MDPDERERIAETVRRACLDAALQSYQDAGMAGLCAEGRWEAAVDAIRSLDVSRLVPGGDATGREGA